MASGPQLTPSNAVGVFALGLLPALSNADLLDAVASALNELDRRGDDVELRERSISSRWADITLGEKGFTAVFHDYSIAAQASEPVNAEQASPALTTEQALAGLTPEDRERAERMLTELYARGYEPREKFNELAPGVRIRHDGQQFHEAYRHGTGFIVAIVEKDPSSWSQTYSTPDVEMVVAFDEPPMISEQRVLQLANYHVQVVDR